MWLWSSETGCSGAEASSGLAGRAGSACGVTRSHVCPGDSTWLAGTQNQSAFLGMAKASAGDFDWQTARGNNTRGVLYFSRPRKGGFAAGAMTAGWFALASPAKPPKSGLDRQ